jgi:glycosyltransferase involved in cell wall biosynthesis
MEGRVARGAVLNTCASRALADVVAARFGIPRDRIRIVPNAVDHDLFTPAPSGGRRPPTVLYVGKVAPLKGAADLAEAIPRILRRVPDARVVLAGSDHPGTRLDSTRAEILATLRAAGAASRVTFLAPMARSDLVRVYQAADVCVLPTLWDNFPNTCLEAMACGVPVVATAVGGLPEIIRDGDDGVLVPPHDPARIADATVGLLLDGARRRVMGEAARRRILTAYTMGTIASQTAEVYEDARRRFAARWGARMTDGHAAAAS